MTSELAMFGLAATGLVATGVIIWLLGVGTRR